jgi:hypothetical protein
MSETNPKTDRGQWYFKIMGEEFGPFTSSQLKELAKSGQLGRETSVRRGDSSWTPATKVRGLFVMTSDETDPVSVKPQHQIPDDDQKKDTTDDDILEYLGTSESQESRPPERCEMESEVPPLKRRPPKGAPPKSGLYCLNCHHPLPNGYDGMLIKCPGCDDDVLMPIAPLTPLWLTPTYILWEIVALISAIMSLVYLYQVMRIE